MKMTNKLGLPESIVRAVSVDNYKRKAGVFSVTQLLAPAFKAKLEREHAEALEEDAADRIWSMMGQMGHAIAERASEFNALSEERMTVDFGGVRISGQVDLFDKDGVLSDFKFTTVYKAAGSPEWTAQLNCYAWLLREQGFTVNKLQIVAVFRDHIKSKAGQDGYPCAPVGVIPVSIWSDEAAEALLTARIAEHTSASPTPCTDEERWATKPVFAVMKDGRKSAVKLHDDDAAAVAHALELGKGHSVTERPKVFKRCEAYCSASAFCPNFKKED